jgi:transposase
MNASSLVSDDLWEAIEPLLSNEPRKPKGGDSSPLRRALRSRGIMPRLARRGIDSSERLGLHRWIVERLLSWLLGYRRLGVRYERRANVLPGLLHLAPGLICLGFLAPPTV